MTNKTATLNSFHPTSLDDIADPSPEAVIEQFDEMSQWETEVSINDRATSFLVGRLLESNPRTFEVYYPPESNAGTGVAGTLAYQHHYNAPEDDYVAFEPAPDDDEEDSADQPVILVEDLRVEQHTRTEQLDAVLPLVRDALMPDSEWVVDPDDIDGEIDLSKGRFLVSPEDIDDPTAEPWLPVRADAGYGEWLTATNTLADFRDEAYDNPSFALEPQAILGTRVMHAIARYPLDARAVVSNVDEEIVDAGGNPEALRTLLIDYAIENISLDTVETSLTAGTKST